MTSSSLRHLNLAKNRLEVVDFRGLKSLEELDLSENEDIRLEMGSLSPLRDNLRRLSLKSCGFESWKELKTALAPLDRLQELTLSGNKFQVQLNEQLVLKYLKCSIASTST